MSYTAGDVMDLSASFLNDKTKRLYKYDIQLPFLKVASDDMEAEIIDNGIPIVNVYCDINVVAGAKILSLPCDFFIPISLEERLQTSTNDGEFIGMSERDFVPSMEEEQSLLYWAFRDNDIKFSGATTDRTVRLRYKRTLSGLTDYSVVGEVTKAKNYLAARTASLCARHIGGNIPKADDLNVQADIFLDKLISIFVKNTQGTRKRRKPFRVPTFGRISGRF